MSGSGCTGEAPPRSSVAASNARTLAGASSAESARPPFDGPPGLSRTIRGGRRGRAHEEEAREVSYGLKGWRTTSDGDRRTRGPAAALSPRTFCTSLRELSSCRRSSSHRRTRRIVLEELSIQRSSSLFPRPFRLLEPLGHLLVLRGHPRPTLCRSVPAIVPDGQVDPAVDEELHRLGSGLLEKEATVTA
jgi:hypothetical protein